MKPLLNHINELFKIEIKNPNLFITAFQHTSYVNESNRKQPLRHIQSNERLEYLGDAVLELIVSQFLFHYYPEEPEGFLSRTRASLVQEETLAILARQMKFGQFIELGKGERVSGGQDRSSILSDCFEAFLGALYLDQGLECVSKLLKTYLLDKHQAFLNEIQMDYKTIIQEYLQMKGSVLIEYRLLSESGPDHNRTFEMGLYTDGEFLARGFGKSKKQAEMAAAKAGLVNKKELDKFQRK